MGAELDARVAFGLGTILSGMLKIISAVLNVLAKSYGTLSTTRTLKVMALSRDVTRREFPQERLGRPAGYSGSKRLMLIGQTAALQMW